VSRDNRDVSPASRTIRRRAAAVAAAMRSHRQGTPPPRTNAALQAAVARDVADAGHMRRLLAFVLARDSNCVDVGANHGTVLADITRIAPAGRHVAFEPIPQLCEELRRAYPDVEVRQAALYNVAGESTFSHVHGSADGWSGLRFRPLPAGEDAMVEEISVRLEVLDQVLDPDYRPALVKIDVEGAELQVLEGSLRTLRTHRPIVIFEHGTGSAEAYGTAPNDVFELLDGELDFRIFDLDGGGPYGVDEFIRTYYASERVNFVAHA